MAEKEIIEETDTADPVANDQDSAADPAANEAGEGIVPASETTSTEESLPAIQDNVTQELDAGSTAPATLKAEQVEEEQMSEGEARVTTRIFTLANIISIIRLCLIPAFFVLLLDGHNILATFIFALAAGTDFIDGYIARSTKTVSKLGQVLDPVVDRLLMVSGVLGVYLVGRVPLWMILLVLLRDILLIVGGLYFMTRYKVRPKVVFMGKVTTTLLFIGFAGMILNHPLINGLGVVNVSWLPGFNSEPVCWAIWFIYLGLLIGLFTTLFYIGSTFMKVGAVKAERARAREVEGESSTYAE